MTGASPRRRCARVVPALAVGLAFAVAPADAMTAREAKNKAFNTMNQGTQLYEQGDYRGAIDLLRQSVGIALNSFQAHYQLGLALREARLYQEAVEPLRVAIDLNPKHLQAHVALGDCHAKLGDAREAEAEYQRALDLQPDYAAAFDGIGRLMEAIGRPEDAIHYYQRAIEANVGYPNAHLDLGDLYQRQGRLQEAITLLTKAIQIRPDFAAAYNRLGVAYARQHLWQEAIAALREASRLEPKNPFHPYTMGRMYLDLGSLRWARESLERAMALDPTFSEVYAGLAALARREGDYGAALAAIENGLNRVPDAAGREALREERARIEAEQERLARLEERVQLKGDVGAAAELARHHARTGDHEKASRILEGRLSLENGDPDLLAEWGYYQIKARRYAEARSTFEALVGRREKDYTARVNLGIAEAGGGRIEQAIEAYQAAQRLKPLAPEAALYLGNLYLRLGEYGRARESYEGYLKVAVEEEGMGRVRKVLELLQQLEQATGETPPAEGPGEPGGSGKSPSKGAAQKGRRAE